MSSLGSEGRRLHQQEKRISLTRLIGDGYFEKQRKVLSPLENTKGGPVRGQDVPEDLTRFSQIEGSTSGGAT